MRPWRGETCSHRKTRRRSPRRTSRRPRKDDGRERGPKGGFRAETSLDAVRVTESMQLAVALDDPLGNPRALLALGALADNGFEIRVRCDFEFFLLQHAPQTVRDVEVFVERNDRARIGREPADAAPLCRTAIGKMPRRYAVSSMSGSSTVRLYPRLAVVPRPHRPGTTRAPRLLRRGALGSFPVALGYRNLQKEI